MKVFWSWQSDTPGKIGRHLIRDALREAIAELKQPQEIEEPTLRETREELHLDHDIQGETGTPDLAATILRKIDEAAVFIADVTLVGQLTPPNDETNKKLINSNVAIELGYALHALTDKRILLVFNTAYGTHEELPFDLRHKGGAIVFNLSETATRPQAETAKRILKAAFIARLEPYLAEVSRASEPALIETPSTDSKAMYFDRHEPLAYIGVSGEDEIQYRFETQRLCYLRIIPTARLSTPIALARLEQLSTRAPLLHNARSLLSDRNRYGAIVYDPANNPRSGPGLLAGSTQLFENGEVWCITTRLIASRPESFAPDTLRLPFIPSMQFERRYIATLELLTELMTQLGVSSPWTVEAGIVEAAGLYITLSDGQRGPIRKGEVVHRGLIKDKSAAEVTAFLLKFFEMVFDATGYPRPQRLNGFP
jgi:hypothetical protein